MPEILLEGRSIFADPAPPVPPQVDGRGLRFLYNEEVFQPGTDAAPPRFAGTHSGVVTTLWTELPSCYYGIAFAGGGLFEDEATYDLVALAKAGKQPAQQAGQITVRGVFPMVLGDQGPDRFAGGATPRIAITGGTLAYSNGRGQLIYETNQRSRLVIEL